MIRNILACAGIAVCAFSYPGHASAATTAEPASSYPERTVRLVIGFPPGGPTDIMARLFAQYLGDELKGNVIVENRPGAGSTIATDQVAKAVPDGYTLLLGTLAGQGIAPNLYQNLPYDPVNDLTPIAMLSAVPNMLVINPSLPVSSVVEMVNYATERPGQVNYASTGNGTSQHLATELFKSLTKVDMLGINYRGSAPAITDLIAGHTSLMFDNVSVLTPYVKAGTLRPLAVTSMERLEAFPELPTMQEAGVPGYEIVSWFGLLGPAGMPAPVVEKIAQASSDLLQRPQVRARLAELSAAPIFLEPGEFDAKVKEELAKWGEVIKTANIQLN